jgi:hypothetical protein
MDANSRPDDHALATAEQVLRTIYGDDLHGCPVSLETIGRLIQDAAEQRGTKELIDLYERLVEAIHLLSTAPNASQISDAKDLQALLGERLDAIHTLTTKTLSTTAPFRTQQK